MRSGKAYLAACMLLWATTAALANDGVSVADSSPWHVSNVNKLQHARAAAAVETPGPHKYLHIQVDFRSPTATQKKHKFRIVDGQGNEVGELWGWNDARSLVIFEGKWDSLVGLYLDSADHREPLWRTVAVAPSTVAPSTVTTSNVPTQPVIVDAPVPRQVVTTPSYVPDQTRVVQLPDRVYVPGGTDRVIEHVPDRIVTTAPDRVIHTGPDRVVYDGPDQVIHYGGGTTHVYDEPDRVIHHGGDTKHVYHDGDRVVHHGGGTRHVYDGDRVVHHGDAHSEGGGDRVVHHYDGGTTTHIHHGDGTAHKDVHIYEGADGGNGGPGDGLAGSGVGNSGVGMGPGMGPGSAADLGEGVGPGDGEGVGLGTGLGPGEGLASAEGMGPGEGTGPGTAPGMGSGPGQGPGEAPGAGPGEGPGQGPGQGLGPGEGPAAAPGEGPGPGEGMAPADAMGQAPGQAPGEGPGPGVGPGVGPGAAPGTGPGGPGVGPGVAGAGGVGPGAIVPQTIGPNVVGPRVIRPDVPNMKLKDPRTFYDPRVLYDPRVAFDPRLRDYKLGDYRPGMPGYGAGGGGGPGAGGGEGDVPKGGVVAPGAPPELPPAFVLYLSTGDELGPGKVYQLDENGRVLGIKNVPYTPTGMALHRTHGLVLAMPRDGGKIMKIDDTGKLSTILEKDKKVVHPIDVGIGGDSDTIVIADNIADVLAATSIGGIKPKVYQSFESQKWTAQDMSVAVTKDKHVIFGTDGERGIFRFAGDDFTAQSKPLLPEPGGVAADPKSLRWAATQKPNLIYVFEGEELVKKLRLPPGKMIYRNGLLSFSPAGSLCVACRDQDKAQEEPWLLMYNIEDDEIRSLFPWQGPVMTDFVVGPRMYWERNSPNTYKSIY